MQSEFTPPPLPHKSYGIEDIKLLIRDYSKEGFMEVDPSDPRVASGPIKYFISDNKKILIDNTAPYFHLLLMWLYPVLKELNESSEVFTIIFRHKSSNQQIKDNNLGSITDYLVKRIRSMGHEVDFLDEKTGSFYINNFNLYDHPTGWNIFSTGIVAEFLSKDLDYSKKPVEKVYLSRAKVLNKINGKDAINDERASRINNPTEIEDYFRSLGFKIIFPEDLNSFEEQLQMLASTRILMSITSAALATSIVMPPGGTIVELSYPLAPSVDSNNDVSPNSVFHHHYKILATVSKNAYLAIPHQGSALDVINFIENNTALKNFLSS